MKFKVEVCRTGYGFGTITVEAKDEREAEQIALDEAGSFLFSEKHSEYSAQSITPVVEESILKNGLIN